MPQHRKPKPLVKPADRTPDAGFSLPVIHPAKEPLTRRRSVAITLGVLGVAAAGFAALSGKDVQRNSYASLEDCEHDYATGQCTQDRPVSGSGSHYGGYHYYGPWYRSDWRGHSFKGDPGPGRSFAGGGGVSGHGPAGFDFGSRGGFGSSGRIAARGG